jgi:DNA polymerase elongation subunit (family B)
MSLGSAYIVERLRLHRIPFAAVGKLVLPEADAKLVSKISKISSEQNYIIWPGITHVDTLKFVQDNYSLDSYALDRIAEDLLKVPGKIDLSPGEIFARSVSGPEGLAEVVTYCVQEVELVRLICTKRSCVMNMYQEPNIFKYLTSLATRALGAKIWNLVHHFM